MFIHGLSFHVFRILAQLTVTPLLALLPPQIQTFNICRAHQGHALAKLFI
ncbi:hypothetical protein [Vibrio vulnificus YJ016]|uniref:Uncharacterized protein n=1 Tax=Vibrio vulnificus (strain YJ016) TaxID=196600 RepID=Q7MD75_VIBVY|nr:hypothetical protein [Vibrio vulnificus YJ016]